MAKRATDSFAFDDGKGNFLVVNSENLYADDHPFVKRFPNKFRDANELVIEAATAAPGEKRDVRKSAS